MATKYNLIAEAQQSFVQLEKTNTIIAENMKQIAAIENMSSKQVCESITHVLAGLAQNAGGIHPRSIAGLLAAVERLSTSLVNLNDPAQKQATLRILADAALKQDPNVGKALPNGSVVKLIQYGNNFPQLMDKYSQLVQNPEALQQTAQKLSMQLQRAMNTSSQSATVAANPQTAGTQKPAMA